MISMAMELSLITLNDKILDSDRCERLHVLLDIVPHEVRIETPGNATEGCSLDGDVMI